MKTTILIALLTMFCQWGYSQQKIEVEGAIKLGTATVNEDGTIQSDNNDIEGRVQGEWTSLTATNPNYRVMYNLNNASYNLNNQDWTAIGPTQIFTKEFDHTTVEMEFGGYISASSINNGGLGLRFGLRLKSQVT